MILGVQLLQVAQAWLSEINLQINVRFLFCVQLLFCSVVVVMMQDDDGDDSGSGDDNHDLKGKMEREKWAECKPRVQIRQKFISVFTFVICHKKAQLMKP